jgi:hypothetical protein
LKLFQSLFPKGNRSKKGNFVIGFMFLVGGTSLILFLTKLNILNVKYTEARISDSKHVVTQISIVETFLYAFRRAEYRYLRALSNARCVTANPLPLAMEQGAQCKSALGALQNFSVTLFTAADFPPGESTGLFVYSGPGIIIKNRAACQRADGAADCGSALIRLVLLRGLELSSTFDFQILLKNAQPKNQIVEFRMEATPLSPSERPYNASFAIRNTLPNSAHLEQDGRVTQVNPDPLHPCAGSPWATYRVYNEQEKKCVNFEQLASGTGLFFYQGNYGGYRPDSGTLIDILSGATNSQISQAGYVGGVQKSPAHTRARMINFDDLTMIENEIYYIRNKGRGELGALDRTTNAPVPMCDLSVQGWSQSFSGIAALSWSDPLLSSPADQHPYATFYLKSDTGDLLTTTVLKVVSGYECFTVKDASLQQIEFSRTYGFDRTDDVKPYFIY